MKDYYKILGVKKNASEEEIRARWVKLTKYYHPDRGEDKASDERIKEINEAYQVLKHSSTRVEYDLRRTYGQGKSRREKGSYFKKLGVSVSILIVFIIFSMIYIKNSQSPLPSELIVSNKIDQINQIDKRNATNPIAVVPTTQNMQVTHLPQPPVGVINPPNVTIPASQTNPITQLPNDLTPHKLNDPIDQIDQINLSPLPCSESVRGEMRSLFPMDQINQIDPELQLAQFKPPSLLVTEDEIRKFFDNYIERYNRMDIEGFLSLFSLKAIQNQKDGLEGIRKIYTNFFNQGQGVHYNMQDMEIEIYQNAVKVKARYKIEQILKMSGEKKVWRGNVRWMLNKENEALKIISLDYQHQKSA